MSDWLYRFFCDVVSPLLFTKDGKHLSPPQIFGKNGSKPATFWIQPPEPVVSLTSHQFDPTILYRPRVFLWLPHFLVKDLMCPNCKKQILEKNGACPPRRIVDIEDSFYVVTWTYYCRKGCQSHFRGWTPSLLDSLPPYLRLAFPAVLSRRSGLSHRVLTQLRVGNQHKMGPSGVRSLLFELHTHRFNVLQAQYVEAVFEVVRGRQEMVDSSQQSLHAYISSSVPPFGDFSDVDKYAGFVPSENYLTQMMNKAIEHDEHDANQHTSCLAPDQLAIDDSHKVSHLLLFN